MCTISFYRAGHHEHGARRRLRRPALHERGRMTAPATSSISTFGSTRCWQTHRSARCPVTSNTLARFDPPPPSLKRSPAGRATLEADERARHVRLSFLPGGDSTHPDEAQGRDQLPRTLLGTWFPARALQRVVTLVRRQLRYLDLRTRRVAEHQAARAVPMQEGTGLVRSCGRPIRSTLWRPLAPIWSMAAITSRAPCSSRTCMRSAAIRNLLLISALCWQRVFLEFRCRCSHNSENPDRTAPRRTMVRGVMNCPVKGHWNAFGGELLFASGRCSTLTFREAGNHGR